MPNIVVSAHGGRWSSQAPDMPIPANSTICFYVADGGCLSNADGWVILNNLFQGIQPGGNVVERDGWGDSTYDYACWYQSGSGVACGIFEVGTGTLLKDLSPYTGRYPLLLSQIFAEFPGCVVYWDACRTVSPGDAEELLTGPEDAYPGPRPD